MDGSGRISPGQRVSGKADRLELLRRCHHLAGVLLEAAGKGRTRIRIRGTDMDYCEAWTAELRDDIDGPPEPYVLIRPIPGMNGAAPDSVSPVPTAQELEALLEDHILVGMEAWPSELFLLEAPVTCGQDGSIEVSARIVKAPICLALMLPRTVTADHRLDALAAPP